MACAHLEPTIFTNAFDGNVTYGFRFYDDYGKMYSNTLAFTLASDVSNKGYKFPDDTHKLIRLAHEELSGVDGEDQMWEYYLHESESGIMVRGEFFTPKELRDILGI
jgi:hypothetical protein